MHAYNDHNHRPRTHTDKARTHTDKATLRRGSLAVCLEGAVAPEEKLANGIIVFLKMEDEAMNQGM